MLNKFVMLTLLCFTSSIYLCLIVIFCYLSALLSHYISGTIDKSVVYTIAHHLECLAEFYNAYKYSNDQGRVIHVSFVNSDYYWKWWIEISNCKSTVLNEFLQIILCRFCMSNMSNYHYLSSVIHPLIFSNSLFWNIVCDSYHKFIDCCLQWVLLTKDSNRYHWSHSFIFLLPPSRVG